MSFPFFGALGQGFLDFASAREANREMRKMSERQMAFQERMSSTAYQRQMADMEAAGINPIYGFGGGASTPQGSVPPVKESLGRIGSTALTAKRQIAEIQKLKADTAFVKALGSGAGADAVVKNIDADISRTWFGKLMRYFNAGKPAAEVVGTTARTVGSFVK